MATFLSPSLLIWSSLPTTWSSSDQELLFTLCYCHVQVLAILDKTEKEKTQNEWACSEQLQMLFICREVTSGVFMWVCRPCTARLQGTLFTWTIIWAVSPGIFQWSSPNFPADNYQNSRSSCFLLNNIFKEIGHSHSSARKIWIEPKQRQNWYDKDKIIPLSFHDIAAALVLNLM